MRQRRGSQRPCGRLNEDPEINGVLVQLPLPAGIDQEAVIGAVSPVKDVDGFHPCNLGRLFSGRPRFSPCTPAGIMTLLAEYGIDPAGRRAVVVGRSIDVGRPMAALLLNADATVTVCHSRTEGSRGRDPRGRPPGRGRRPGSFRDGRHDPRGRDRGRRRDEPGRREARGRRRLSRPCASAPARSRPCRAGSDR